MPAGCDTAGNLLCLDCAPAVLWCAALEMLAEETVFPEIFCVRHLAGFQ